MFSLARIAFSLYYSIFVRLWHKHIVSGRGECYDALFGSSIIFERDAEEKMHVAAKLALSELAPADTSNTNTQ